MSGPTDYVNHHSIGGIMRLTTLLLVPVLTLISVAAAAADGDIIQGKPVIERLDLDALESRKIHHLYFESVEMGSGQHW